MFGVESSSISLLCHIVSNDCSTSTYVALAVLLFKSNFTIYEKNGSFSSECTMPKPVLSRINIQCSSYSSSEIVRINWKIFLVNEVFQLGSHRRRYNKSA